MREEIEGSELIKGAQKYEIIIPFLNDVRYFGFKLNEVYNKSIYFRYRNYKEIV